MAKYKDMDMYHYVFHYSPFRDNDKQWACIHREEQHVYWNGLEIEKSKDTSNVKITYGNSPDDAFKKILKKD
jgi:hypothetical protein